VLILPPPWQSQSEAAMNKQNQLISSIASIPTFGRSDAVFSDWRDTSLRAMMIPPEHDGG
jgi:hypothetical protein